MFNRNSSKHGFTLVETLVVLVIIGVLAALLFPVFARVREDARKATCQSNLQQIGLAIQQYKQDNKGFYPPAFQNGLAWTKLLDPYAKNKQILTCPSQSTPWRYDYGSNAINTWIFTPKKVFIYGKHESTLKDETSTIVLGDSAQMVDDSQDNGGATSAPSMTLRLPPSCQSETPIVPGSEGVVPTVHAGGGNVAFADGHVKWLSPAATIDAECSSDFFR